MIGRFWTKQARKIFKKGCTTFIGHPELHNWSKFQLNISLKFKKETWIKVSQNEMCEDAQNVRKK